MITGVETCGTDLGYCLLGNDCTMDDDFLPDPTGNCSGLHRAFTPVSKFVCCKLNKQSLEPGTPTVDFQKKASIDAEKELYEIIKNTTFIRAADMASNTKNTTTIKAVDAMSNKKNTNPIKAADELDGGKNVISISAIDEMARNTRENVDPSKIDNEQLEKLNQIESVVKKIIEHLINETANNVMKVDGAAAVDGSETKMVENTTINDIEEDEKMFASSSEIKETSTPDPLAKPEETFDDGQFKTEVASEDKEDDDTMDEPDTIEPEAEDSDIDDEFKAEKNICQKTCKSEVIFMVDKKPMCYGTLLDDIWILTSATCASR